MAWTVGELWRYPVKSMQGERVERAEVSDAGLRGDRGYVVIDVDLGRVGSAKHPRLWGDLLLASARYVDEPTPDEALPPVAITFPDGTETRSDAPDVDERLSSYLGRPVRLSAETPAENQYFAVWPTFEGVMPDDVRRSAALDSDDERVAADASEGTLAQHGLSLAAPPGTHFDVSALHLVTTATLKGLTEVAPESDFDVRRYRPNVLIDTGDESPFLENGWTGTSLAIGSAGVVAAVIMPTMRCIMTTLAQPGLPRDKATLQTVAAHNRVDMPGMGTWSCVGAYAIVTAGGEVRSGDPVVGA